MLRYLGINFLGCIAANVVLFYPAEIVCDWLSYFRGCLGMPAVPFKVSTQQTSSWIGHRKMNKCKRDMEKAISLRVGVELVMTLLANYCRSNKIKMSIVVGVEICYTDMPNVGKSRLINNLKRARVCQVGVVPGITRYLVVIKLNLTSRKHVLILCPST